MPAVIYLDQNIPARPRPAARPRPVSPAAARAQRAAKKARTTGNPNTVQHRGGYNLRRRAQPTQRGRYAPTQIDSAQRGFHVAYQFPAHGEEKLEPYLVNIRPHLRASILAELVANRTVKVQLVVRVLVRNPNDRNDTDERPLMSKHVVVAHRSQVNKAMRVMEQEVQEALESTQGVGSNWAEGHVLGGYLNSVGWHALRGGMGDVKLPFAISSKHACIDINTAGTVWDGRCLLLAMTVWRHAPRDANAKVNGKAAKELSQYASYIDEWNTAGLSMPMKLTDIEEFELLNRVRINVYGIEKCTTGYCNTPSPNKELNCACRIYPMHLSTRTAEDDTLPLAHLLLYGEDAEDGIGHYAWVHETMKMLRMSGNGNDICERCLEHFKGDADKKETSKHLFDKHMAINCRLGAATRRGAPAVSTTMPPSNSKYKFEALNKQVKTPFYVCADFKLDDALQLVGYSMRLVCTFNDAEGVGDDYYESAYDPANPLPVARQFLDELHGMREKMGVAIAEDVGQVRTAADNKAFKEADTCWICKEGGFEGDAALGDVMSKVWDHDHLSGAYRGAAHWKCNIKVNLRSWRLPVILHDLKKRCTGFIIRELDADKLEKVEAIGTSVESLLSFSMGGIKFIDSRSFLNSDLEKLYARLPTQRPSPTRLSMLCDVWADFSALCYRDHGLDPSYYVGTPGFSDDAMRKQRRDSGESIKWPVELLTDSAMYNEARLRGGVCHASGRHVKANHRGMGALYDPAQPSTWLSHYDATSMYPTVMCEYLPCGDYQYPELSEWNRARIMALAPDGELGALCSVDLRIPPELHAFFADFPPLPEHKNGKLVLDLSDKTDYLIHYRRLQQVLSWGVELVAIKSVITFRQAPWLRSYMLSNATKREQATSKFEQDYYKLCNNVIWGRLGMDVRKQTKVRFVADEHKSAKVTAKCNYKQSTIITTDVWDEKTGECLRPGVSAMETIKTSVCLDKPILTAFAILELAKLKLFAFYYDVLKPRWPTARLEYCDTDSLVVSIQTEDLVADVQKDEAFHAMLDCSSFPPDHALYNTHNKKRLGSWKEEAGYRMSEVVALKKKQWSSRTLEGQEVKKAAGIDKAVTDKQLRFEHYAAVVATGQPSEELTSTRVKSELHVLRTLDVTSRLRPMQSSDAELKSKAVVVL